MTFSLKKKKGMSEVGGGVGKVLREVSTRVRVPGFVVFQGRTQQDRDVETQRNAPCQEG